MRPLDDVFEALRGSTFRRRFHLSATERAYLEEKGLPVVVEHARGFVARRLAPAQPANDGRQTPYRGHPVFVAQHATACCCRGCLSKWHGIDKGHALSDAEQAHVVQALARWLAAEASRSED